MAEASDAVDSVVFQNPIIRGFNPDPSICVVPATESAPETYFLSTSTFEFFPGCAIYASTDLLNWKLIGHALTRPSQIHLRTVEPGAGAWASTLRYRTAERRWYLTTCLFQRYRPATDERIFPRGFYVCTDNIWDDNAWSDPVYFDNPGFDQDLFWDDDGKVYLSTTVRIANRPAGSKLKDFAIHLSEIDLPTGRTLTPPAVIRQSPHGLAEGSHIIKRGKYYYLLTAEGGTEAGHQEWVLRSTEGVYGPWESTGRPLWYNGPDEEVQRTGHADVFEDGRGRWWAVLLGVRPVKHQGKWLEPQLGRETFLVKVDWVDDWPVFNDGKNISLLTQSRGPIPVSESIAEDGVMWKADLDRSDLELGWYQKDTPLKQCYALTEQPGFLRLYGNCYDLSSPEGPAMLLRKQASYSESFHVKLQFDPRKAGYEAGLVLWWSQFSYATVGITTVALPSGETVRTVVRRSPTGQSGVMTTTYPLLTLTPENEPTAIGSALPDRGLVSLEVECFDAEYRLAFHSGDPHDRKVVIVKASELTVMPPVGGAFTGVMYGIYAFGKGEPVLDPADFTDIKVTQLK